MRPWVEPDLLSGFRLTMASGRPRSPALLLAPLLLVFVAATLVVPIDDLGDEAAYQGIAHRILDGDYAAPPGPDAVAYLWHGPGLPLLLAPLVAVDAPSLVMRLLLGALPLFLAVLLFERLLRLQVSRRWALAGAAALGLYAPLHSLLPALHKESLSALLVVGTLYFTARYLTERGWWAHLAGAGLSAGWLILTRLEYGSVAIAALALALVWAAWRRKSTAPRRLALVYCVALLVASPWLVYTYLETEKPLYWGNAGGLSLYWMAPHRAHELGDWNSFRTVFERPELAHHRVTFARLRGLPPVEKDAALQRIAWSRIRARPARYARNVAANTSRLVFGLPYSFKGPGPVAFMYAAVNLALLAALVLGLVTMVRRRIPLRPVGVAFAQLAVLSFGVHLFISADPRMFMPVVPMVLWFAVTGLSARLPGSARASARAARRRGATSR